MSNWWDDNIVRAASKERSPLGGQSVPAFDHYMAPGVAKSFIKELVKILRIRYPECSLGKEVLTDSASGKLTNEGIKEELKKYRKKHRLIMNERGYQFIRYLFAEKYMVNVEPSKVDMLIKMATAETEEATYQAMEAVIHNLNSMHCLPYSEKIWVYDVKHNEFKLMPIGELTEKFEANRYKVISLNKETGKAEFKFITHAKRMDNHRRLITIESNQGAKVTVTDNHRVMTMNGLSVTEGLPESIKSVISPRGIKTPQVNNDICLSEYGSVRKDSPYLEEHVVISTEFAELMGYYMADGCFLGSGSNGVMCITTCGKVPFTEMSNLVSVVFGTKIKENYTYFEHSTNGITEKDIRFSVGTRLGRMLVDKFGRTSKDKKVPIEIMFGPNDVKEAFLKAYFRCDGRKDKNYSEVSTVNKELQQQIAFMILSLKGSPHYTTRKCTSSSLNKKYRVDMNFITLSGEDSVMVGIKDSTGASFSIPKYDLTMVPYKTSKRRSGNVRYSELEDMVITGVAEESKHLLNIFVNEVKSVTESNSGEEYVYDISVEDNENFMTAEGIYVHNSRAGRNVCPNNGKPLVRRIK